MIPHCKLLDIGKQLPTFPHVVWGFKPLTSEVGGEYVTYYNTESPPPPCMLLEAASKCTTTKVRAQQYIIYLFGVLHRFQHCTGHIATGSWKGRGNQYIQSVRVLYCKLPTNGKQLPAFPLEAVLGIEPRPQMWEVRVLPPSNIMPK